MKKLESTWYNMCIVLTVIAVVAGAALGYVNELTKGPIEEIKAQQLSDGIKAVLGGEAQNLQPAEPRESGAIVYRADNGTAVQTSDPNGFGGTLTVLVGFDQEGNILGYRVLESSETPGLGAKAGEWFQATGKGSIIGMNPGTPLAVSKDGGQVDAITASTITSRAFLRCVNAAYAALSGEQDGQSGATQKHVDESALEVKTDSVFEPIENNLKK